MQNFVFVSFMLFVALAKADYRGSQASCEPSTEIVVVTKTSLDLLRDRVTAFDLQYSHSDLQITRTVFATSTFVQTISVTQVPLPQILTSSSYVTASVFKTLVTTHEATTAVTRTQPLWVTKVVLKDLTLKHTVLDTGTVTRTLTQTRFLTAFDTRTSTVIRSAYVTTTELRPFYVTKAHYQTLEQRLTSTVTSLQRVQEYYTLTKTEYVVPTKCYRQRDYPIFKY